jgi:hypothetical protein
VSDLAKAVIAVILGVLLSIGILIAISDDPSHQMLLDQQDLMIENQRVVLCLMLFDEEDRGSADVVATCQTAEEPPSNGG